MTQYTDPVDFWDNAGMIAAGPSGDMANQIALVIGETDIEMGMLCSINSSGKAVKGLDDEGCMPIWSVSANEESTYDRWSGGNYADTATGEQVGIGGKANFVAGNGGIEIFTNQYKTGQTYTAGRTKLTNCTTLGDGAAYLGQVKPASATLYNDGAVVGVVSRGLQTDRQSMTSRQVLYLWPVYMPPVGMTDNT